MIFRNAHRKIPAALAILAVLVVGILLPGHARAQVVGGTLSGTVTDPSGAAIPGTRISIKNVATGVTTNVYTRLGRLLFVSQLAAGDLRGHGLNRSDPYDFPNRLTGPGCGSLINPGYPNNVKTQCFALPSAPSMAFWQADCDTTSAIFSGPGGNLIPEPFPYCFNLRGNAGRDIIPGPGLVNVDFSVFKNNPIRRISENFDVQFRVEAFNILNRANFSFPQPEGTGVGDAIFDSTGAPTGTAGLITSTTTAAREIQFALKLIW